MKGVNEINGGGCGGFGRRDGGHGDMGGEPREGVDDALCGGFGDPDAIAAVVASGGAQVPSIDGMGGPSAANGWFFVD